MPAMKSYYLYQKVGNYDKNNTASYYERLRFFDAVFCIPNMIFLLDLLSKDPKALHLSYVMLSLNIKYKMAKKMMNILLENKVVRKNKSRYIIYPDMRHLIKLVNLVMRDFPIRSVQQPNTLG